MLCAAAMPCCSGPATFTSLRSGAVISISAAMNDVKEPTVILPLIASTVARYSTPARAMDAIVCTIGLLMPFVIISFMCERRLCSMTFSNISCSYAWALKTRTTRGASIASLATRVTSPIEFWMRLL